MSFGSSASAANPIELKNMKIAMRNRGPDGEGEWVSEDQRVSLAHTRLAIIDLSDRGGQPFVSDCGKYVITFNGEIYNHRSLRLDLEKKGFVFRSDTDTEVLLQLYRVHGKRMLALLRGMFSFAIWDTTRKTLFAARDLYGIKPFYYSVDKNIFRFSSQVKALVEHCDIAKDRDPAGVIGFFLYGSVPEPFTLFENIRSLDAGCFLELDLTNGRVTSSEYDSVKDAWQGIDYRESLSDAEIQSTVRECIVDSIKTHLVSDVEVGVFLSSGIDSCAILGVLHDLGVKDLRALTLRFEEFIGEERDESILAAKVAQHYGFRHEIRTVTRKEMLDDFDSILDAMDQPSIDGINTWFVSKFAREKGIKVALSGVGGDELFSGYPSFSVIPSWMKKMAFIRSFLPFISSLSGPVSRLSHHFDSIPAKLPALISWGHQLEGAYFAKRGLFMPWELSNVFDEKFIEEGLKKLDPFCTTGTALNESLGNQNSAISVMESTRYMKNQLLRDADWAGMANSVEIRTPLVDQVLLKRLAPILARSRKVNRKSYLAGVPEMSLPAEITNRNKTGFETPIGLWLKDYVGSIRSKNMEKLARGHWSRSWATRIYENQI